MDVNRLYQNPGEWVEGRSKDVLGKEGEKYGDEDEEWQTRGSSATVLYSSCRLPRFSLNLSVLL